MLAEAGVGYKQPGDNVKQREGSWEMLLHEATGNDWRRRRGAGRNIPIGTGFTSEKLSQSSRLTEIVRNLH
jgi:hypothetical protein